MIPISEQGGERADRPDDELRLECARLSILFAKGDPIENAERLFRYIKTGAEAPQEA